MIRLLTDNWKYKAGSVLLAGLLWLGVVEESELATSVLVPIQYRNIPKDLEMISDVTDKVHLEIRGPASKLSAAMFTDSSVLIDLRDVRAPGDRTFPIDPANLSLPAGVSLDRAVPAQVRLHFERRLTREVPVSVRLGPVPQGYEVVSQKAEPAQLRIAGPETHVAAVEQVATDAIDVGELRDGNAGEFRVQAYLADPQVRFEGAGSVKVRIQLKRSN